MKVSELIAELEKAMAEHGDRRIKVPGDELCLQRWWLNTEEQEPYIAFRHAKPTQWMSTINVPRGT